MLAIDGSSGGAKGPYGGIPRRVPSSKIHGRYYHHLLVALVKLDPPMTIALHVYSAWFCQSEVMVIHI